MELIVRQSQDDNLFEKYTERIYQHNEIDTLTLQDVGIPRPEEILFITGNKNKLAELEQCLTNLGGQAGALRLRSLSLDLVEIQHSDPLSIVQDKCLRAQAEINRLANSSWSCGQMAGQRAILVEDTCLNFSALGGLPGPYVKCKCRARE